ncbi:unnamed protein product [Penicillium manginii]
MTTIILPTDILSTEPRKRGSYGSLLTHIVRASLDAEEAVHIFASLLLGTHQSGFSKFDAHVGDTACHIRASLVRELYMSCKKEDAEGYASLLSAMAVHFRRIRKAAEITCFQLTQHRANPVVVGFSAKQDTLDNIINALCSLKLDGADVDKTKSISTGPTFNRSFLHPLRFFDSLEQPVTSVLPSEPSHLIRFIIYSYVLSKYKRFIMTKSGLGCRLDPKLACEEGLRLIKPYWNIQNKDYRDATPKPIVEEFNALQAWLSQFGCTWLRSLSTANLGGLLHARQRGMPLTIQWKLTETDTATLAREKSEASPCLVLVGNSINGNNEEYIGRVLDTEKNNSLKNVRHHDDQDCDDFKRHSSKLGAADLDKILLASFGAHKSYCIPRKVDWDEKQEREIILSNLGSHFEMAEFRQMWEMNREAINELGAGPDNLEVFRLQHVFTETRFGVGELIRSWARDDNLSPLPV